MSNISESILVIHTHNLKLHETHLRSGKYIIVKITSRMNSFKLSKFIKKSAADRECFVAHRTGTALYITAVTRIHGYLFSCGDNLRGLRARPPVTTRLFAVIRQSLSVGAKLCGLACWVRCRFSITDCWRVHATRSSFSRSAYQTNANFTHTFVGASGNATTQIIPAQYQRREHLSHREDFPQLVERWCRERFRSWRLLRIPR